MNQHPNKKKFFVSTNRPIEIIFFKRNDISSHVWLKFGARHSNASHFAHRLRKLYGTELFVADGRGTKEGDRLGECVYVELCGRSAKQFKRSKRI